MAHISPIPDEQNKCVVPAKDRLIGFTMTRAGV